MKKKSHLHCEIVAIPNSEPVVYEVITQFVDGGMLHTNSNNEVGWTYQEALELVKKIKEENGVK